MTALNPTTVLDGTPCYVRCGSILPCLSFPTPSDHSMPQQLGGIGYSWKVQQLRNHPSLGRIPSMDAFGDNSEEGWMQPRCIA